MTKLSDIFQAVNDPNLDKWKLESYRDELADLKSKMHLEMAELKSKRAIFESKQEGKRQTEIDREWNGSEDGLRQLKLKEYIRATSTKLSSLRDRLYNTY